MGKMDISLLEKITDQVIDSIEKGKKEIFDISETARQEMNKVKSNLIEIDEDTRSIIDLVDKTEVKERKARVRLMEVSKNFSEHNQGVIQEAYEIAHQLKVELILYRQRSYLRCSMKSINRIIRGGPK